ncbi:hypothetical protein [Rhizobium sp. BK176]|uniref:hypothetical protein n=1 Tax=Rhizobium sp. BK176 TaxID=2587071 RepID=UPI00216A4B4B|nr:hypothetical protein [Rhizobium sp. BK176]MCS4089826.1 hypothetical protein [Rhizobium sp. BK176]
MQIDIKFPMLVRATPASSKKSERYFYGSHIHKVEVPEISLSETEIGLDAVTFTAGSGARRIFPQLRAYDGRLYRPLGNPDGLFSAGHKDKASPGGGDYYVTSPAQADMARRPLAQPVEKRAQWMIDLHGADTQRNYKLWPEENRHPKPPVSRNDFLFSEADLKQVNEDDVAVSMRMFEAQADRLLVIGGKYWMETTMPCLNVVVFERGRGNGVTLDMGFLPLGHAGSTWMRFPLSAFDEAHEFAQQMRQVWRAGEVDIGHADIADIDVSAVDFDHNEEAAHTMALVVGSNLVRRSVQHEFHSVHAESAPLFTGATLQRFEAVKEAVLANNDIVGARSNLIDMTPDILELWQSVKSPRYSGLGLPPAAITPHLIAKAVEMSENTTINVAAIGGLRL